MSSFCTFVMYAHCVVDRFPNTAERVKKLKETEACGTTVSLETNPLIHLIVHRPYHGKMHLLTLSLQ